MMYFLENLRENLNKDILAFRFPETKFIKSDFLKNIKEGRGIKYSEDKVWYPKEIFGSICLNQKSFN